MKRDGSTVDLQEEKTRETQNRLFNGIKDDLEIELENIIKPKNREKVNSCIKTYKL